MVISYMRFSTSKTELQQALQKLSKASPTRSTLPILGCVLIESKEEKTTLSSDGDVVKQKVTGTLTVENPSSNDRLWDIDVFLGAIDNTNIGGDHLAIPELEELS